MIADRRWTAGVVRRVLPNGLTALVQSDPAAPAVAVVIHVKAGFFDEPDHWQGISHVLEHMFFKGTPTRGVGRIASETKALGGYLNASTSYDATSYYVVLPADGFARALDIQADALRHASIDAEELARELVVIIEEARRKLDTPSSVAYETLHKVLFDYHRIRRWRIGTEEMLASFTRDDVVGYYRSRYVPGRVIVSVVGAVDAEAAFDAIATVFDDWRPEPGAVDPSPEEPWRRGVRVETLRGDVRQGELAVGWRGVPPLHPDAAALDLGAALLGAGRGSRLYRNLRQTGLVTSIGAHHYSPAEVGVFSIGADLEPDRVGDALAGMGRELDALVRFGPTVSELERSTTLITAQWARRLETVEGRASTFAAGEALGGVDIIEREYEAMLAVTPADIQDAVKRYVEPELASAVVYLPDGAGADLDPDFVKRQLSEQASNAPSVASPDPIASRSNGRHRPKSVTHAGVEHVALAGADLLVKRKEGVPLISLGIYRRRQSAEARATAGIGALAVRSAARGAGNWDAAALSDVFERLGGTLGTSIAADWFGFGASVLSGNLASAAEILQAVTFEPWLDDAEVAKEQVTLSHEVSQITDDMFRYPMQLALSAAFGDHRYGIPVKGSPESVGSLTVEQVRAWYGSELSQGRSTIVAVGDIDVEAAIDVLAGVFDNGEPRLIPPASTSESVPIRAERREESRSKAQTALTMVFPGPARTDPNRFAGMVLSAIASGLGGRLFIALREQRSLAYTVLMSSWLRRDAGALMTYIATSPDREAEARDTMLDELERFASVPVADEELTQAVNYLVGQTAVQRQTAGALAGEIIDAWLVGTGLDELEDPDRPFREVTREAVHAVARQSLDRARRAEGVVRAQA